jgi:teichuronic acid biosynthesis glycosyltransferase TuaG
MAMPKVSCVITGFNQEDYIPAAIESVLSQTHSAIEAIYVDDGSTDGSVASARRFAADPRLKVVAGAHVGLPAATRNRGIDLAQGDYVAFLDGDDYWLSTKLERQLEAFVGTGVAGVGTAVTRFGAVQFHRTKHARPRASMNFLDLLRHGTVALSSLMVRNEGARFNEQPEFKYVEDFDFQLSLTLEDDQHLVRLAESLVQYRIQRPAVTFDAERATRVLHVLRKYEPFVEPAALNEIRARHLVDISLNALRAGDSRAAEFATAAVAASPPIGIRARAWAIRALGRMPASLRRAVMKAYYSNT